MIAAEGLPVQLATRILGVSESGYCEWRNRPPSARAVRHAWPTGQIQAVHLASRGTYGSRRVHAELTLGLGITVGHGAVEVLMRRAGIKGLPGNRRPRPRHQTPTAGDVVHRQYARPAPDQLQFTDITEHPTREGKVYCAWSWMRARGGWWAGRSTARRPRRWSPAPWTWPFATGQPSPA